MTVAPPLNTAMSANTLFANDHQNPGSFLLLTATTTLQISQNLVGGSKSLWPGRRLHHPQLI